MNAEFSHQYARVTCARHGVCPRRKVLVWVIEEQRMTIERLAEKHKLKVSRDECGDLIIRGKRGHLYVDSGALCAIWTDAPPMMQSRLAELGVTIWQGDIVRDAHGRRAQDAWVRGIRPEAYKLALRLVRAKQRKAISPRQRAALEKGRLARLSFSIPTMDKQHSPGLDCVGRTEAMVSPVQASFVSPKPHNTRAS
jgi:hypothetical protein